MISTAQNCWRAWRAELDKKILECFYCTLKQKTKSYLCSQLCSVCSTCSIPFHTVSGFTTTHTSIELTTPSLCCFIQQSTMGEMINCNFARAAIRHFSNKYLPSSCRFPKGSMPNIVADYNNHFADNGNLQVTYNKASRKFPAIFQIFNRWWHLSETRVQYLTVFGVRAWNELLPEEKQQHTLQKCKSMWNPISRIECCFSMQS